MTWQPINTAPKDGTPFLYWDVTGWCVLRWSDGAWCSTIECEDIDEQRIEITLPAFWMPLPEPPLIDDRTDATSASTNPLPDEQAES